MFSNILWAWGTVIGTIVPIVFKQPSSDLLALLWQDNSLVSFLTTLYTGKEYTIQTRKRPQDSSTSAVITQLRFVVKVPNLQRALLVHTANHYLTLSFINTYNYHMNSVDVADQLRAVYKTHLGMRRNWMCLFSGLLDTAIVNAYLLRRWHLPSVLDTEELLSMSLAANNHKALQQCLVVAFSSLLLSVQNCW